MPMGLVLLIIILAIVSLSYSVTTRNDFVHPINEVNQLTEDVDVTSNDFQNQLVNMKKDSFMASTFRPLQHETVNHRVIKKSVIHAEAGLQPIKTVDLPDSEKNRYTKNGSWLYPNRGLELPPVFNRTKFDLPLIAKGEWHDFTFGIWKGAQLSIYFAYQWLNGTTVPAENTGDIDLLLFKATELTVPIATSTNDEGSPESLVITFEEEGNYTLRIYHDGRDSTKDWASGSVIMKLDQIDFFTPIYFEGRDFSNKPTKFSMYHAMSAEAYDLAAAIASDSLDYYQMRLYDEFYSVDPSYVDDAQTAGIDMGIWVDDYLEYTMNWLEVEAEWGFGFGIVSAMKRVSEGSIRLYPLKLNDWYPLGSYVQILVGAADLMHDDFYRSRSLFLYLETPDGDMIPFSQLSNVSYNEDNWGPKGPNIYELLVHLNQSGSYNIWASPISPIFSTRDLDERYRAWTFTVPSDDRDFSLELDYVGYWGPTPYDNYIVYAKFLENHPIFFNITLSYSIGGKEEVVLMEPLGDGFYAAVLHGIDPSQFTSSEIGGVHLLQEPGNDNGLNLGSLPIPGFSSSQFLTVQILITLGVILGKKRKPRE